MLPSGRYENKNDALQAALSYLRAGLSFIPIARDGSKAPDGKLVPSWHQFKDRNINGTIVPGRLPTEREVLAWFDRPNPPGIGVIGGRVSGNLECLDFDRDAEALFPQWCELVEGEAPGLLARLSVARTPKPGFHVRYRCAEVAIPGNTKLAEDPDAPGKERTLIETRGEGGYALAPGCPPECHETGRQYEHHSGPKLSQVQTITAAEREILIRCARAFDCKPVAKEDYSDLDRFRGDYSPSRGLTPWEDYNRRGPAWQEILGPHGWAFVGPGRVRRPGKDRGWSATVGYCKGKDGSELLAVFSSNAHPFEGPANGKPCSCYSKAAAYALLNHQGDFKAAAKALAELGYGDRPPHRNGTAPGSAAEPANDVGEWDDPVPLAGAACGPPFPLDCLPEVLRAWVQAEAEATQTPPDLAAMLELPTCGAALAKKFRVRVREGWCEPTNLFTMTGLPSGERKTAVVSDAIAPVLQHEREEAERQRLFIAEKASARRVLETRLKYLETRAAKEEDRGKRAALQQEAKQVAHELAGTHVPDAPQYLCNDCTPEKLSQLLARQGGRMFLVGAEGTPIEIAKGRYSDGPNFDVYLCGHSGDELRVHRIGRDPEIVQQPALSVALAVQPDVICGLADQASMRRRGFLARFLYAMPDSRVGRRKIAPAPVPAEVAQRRHTLVLDLWRLPGDVDEQGNPKPHWLMFGDEAEALMREFEVWLEPQLADGEPLSALAGWANKLAGAVARISGVLHMAECVSAIRAIIPPGTVANAVRLAREYLIPHARAAFGVMGADGRVEDAKRVLAWLRREVFGDFERLKAPPRVKRSQVYASVFGGSRSPEEFDRVADFLARHNYLRPLPGTRPAEFEVNPKFAAWG